MSHENIFEIQARNNVYFTFFYTGKGDLLKRFEANRRGGRPTAPFESATE